MAEHRFAHCQRVSGLTALQFQDLGEEQRGLLLRLEGAAHAGETERDVLPHLVGEVGRSKGRADFHPKVFALEASVGVGHLGAWAPALAAPEVIDCRVRADGTEPGPESGIAAERTPCVPSA